MKYESIADIYTANDKIRERFLKTIAGISEPEAAALPDDEKWTIQQLVEHIGIVEHGVSKLCAKLVEGAKSAGKPPADGIGVSADTMEKWAEAAASKLEAPERVQPTGNVLIADTLEQMNINREAFNALRVDLEIYDMSEPKFPHPYFGGMSATEWLILAGGHTARHTAQLEKMLEKIRT